MKQNYSAVLSLLLAGGICCTGCAKAGGEATAAQKLGGSFTTEMTMTMEDWTAAGTLSRLGDGAWSVSFAEPATLAGVVLDFSGGEVTASYKGLGFSVPQSAMPAKSVLSQMIQVVDELAGGDHRQGAGRLRVGGGGLGGQSLHFDTDGKRGFVRLYHGKF
mgnify:CR=1 FL=1